MDELMIVAEIMILALTIVLGLNFWQCIKLRKVRKSLKSTLKNAEKINKEMRDLLDNIEKCKKEREKKKLCLN